MADPDPRAIIDRYGPGTLLAAVMAFMVWIRIQPADRVLTDSGVLFGGNDAWYHRRMVEFTVEHFPATVRFDVWSRFPFGTGRHSGFGGLFDQLVALAALVVGAGEPSPETIALVLAYTPPVMGALTAIPVYLLGRQLTDRWWGLAPVGLLALVGGQFLSRTVVGFSDHHAAEALFGAIALLGFALAVRIAYEEKPLVADLRDRNWIALRRPILAAVLGGVAIASYLMTWPPGVMVGSTFGLFVILQAVRDHADGRPIEYLAIATGVSMAVVGILTLLYVKEPGLSATRFSLLQPLVFLGVGAGAAGLILLGGYVDRQGYPAWTYPAGIAGVAFGVLAVAGLVYPPTLSLLESLLVRVYSFGLLTSPTALTVGEIHPATLQDAWAAFGPLFYVALFGLVIMVVRVVLEHRPVELLVALWSLTMLSAYFTMIRFGYYVAIAVVLLAGYAIWWSADTLLAIDAVIENPTEIRGYQVIGLLIILVAIVPGTVVAVEDRQPVWEQAEFLGGSDPDWHAELAWMNANTPAIPLAYGERVSPPEDGDFDYPPGAYGVMSWWDYGHWITASAKRIPVANPFQEGPRIASAFFQAGSEERAELLLEALPARSRVGAVHDRSDEDLAAIVEDRTEQEASERTRYVVIDDQMVAGKFAPIATWTGPGYGAYVSRQEFQVGEETAQVAGLNDRFHRTMLARLYYQDASGLEHYRLVHESERQITFASVAQRTGDGYQATQYINRRVSPGLLQTVQSQPNLAFYDPRQAARVKTYERVPGAVLTGEVTDANTTTMFVLIEVETNTNRTFTYVQSAPVDDDGSFAITVPYATDNSVDPAAGGTDAAVRTNGSVEVVEGNPFSPAATRLVEVPEPAVYEGRSIDVELDPVERPAGPGAANETIPTSDARLRPERPTGTAVDGAVPVRSDPGPSNARVAVPRR